MLTKTQQFPLHNHCHTLLGRRAQNKSHSMYFFQFNQSVKCLSLKKKNQTLHEDKHNWCLPKHSHDTLLSHRAQIYDSQKSL